MSISFRANWFESVYMQGLSKVHQFFGSLRFHKQSEATPVILSACHASHKPFCSRDLEGVYHHPPRFAWMPGRCDCAAAPSSQVRIQEYTVGSVSLTLSYALLLALLRTPEVIRVSQPMRAITRI